MLTVANGIMKLIGWCPYEKGFDVFKPIEQNSRPKLGLAYNLLMIVVAYMTSYQFEQTNVRFFLILYSGNFIYRL